MSTKQGGCWKGPRGWGLLTKLLTETNFRKCGCTCVGDGSRNTWLSAFNMTFFLVTEHVTENLLLPSYLVKISSYPSLHSRLRAPCILEEIIVTLLVLNVRSNIWYQMPFEILLCEIVNFFTYRILNEADGLIFVFQILFKVSLLQEQCLLSIFVLDCLATLQPPKLVIELLAGFESCLSPPWNNRMPFIYVSNSHCLKGGWYMKDNKESERISILPEETEFMEVVSGAQVPVLHWRLNYFLRFEQNMKFTHLEKSFRFFFPCVAYGMASFPFALPVALLVLLSDSNSVCKSLLPANSKRFHLVITHMPETSFLWMYFAFTASLNVLTFFPLSFFPSLSL